MIRTVLVHCFCVTYWVDEHPRDRGCSFFHGWINSFRKTVPVRGCFYLSK